VLLLLLIFSFGFLCRVAVVFHNEYPPSSDIGFHGSIINLILDTGELPSWNPYHMGGEPLATPPGFHFFVSTLILLSGMPLLLAELITAIFFSSIIVFPAYVIAKRIWKSPNAGLLAAFFATISALSFEMLSWGGYTNVVSLALIVTIFSLFTKDLEKPNHLHLLMGVILFGALTITHTFSLFVFFPVLALYLVLLLIGKALKLKEMKIWSMLRFFVVSVALGVLVVAPWVLRVFSFYADASAGGGLFEGLEANRDLILANRSIEPVFLTLIVVIIPTVLMLKESRNRWVDSVGLLLMAWYFVPIVMTQAYVFGIFTDYSRFMYFIDFPGVIIIAGGLFYLFHYSSLGIERFATIKWNKIKKTLPAIASLAMLFIFISVSLWSIFPSEAMKRVDWYTTIQQPEASAIEWIRNKTPEDSVLVADHLYGWWLSGISKRTTLSAASLEFLIYSHEVEVAKAAQFLLDTNYFIDNGLIQVRDDGPHLPIRNPEFSIETWDGTVYSLFEIHDNRTQLVYEWSNENGTKVTTHMFLSDMEMVEPTVLVADDNSAKLTTTYEDEFSTVKKTVSVQQGVRFAEVTYDIHVKSHETNLFNIFLPIIMEEGNVTIEPSLSWFGFYNPFNKMCGQVIFQEDMPVEITPEMEDTPIRVDLLFREPWERSINIKMLVAVFDAQNLSYPDQVNSKYDELATSPLEVVTSEPVTAWEYTDMLKEYDVSYVVCREQDTYARLSADSKFQRVFIGGDVSVFQVIK
jgi:hypothetical protein